MVEERLPISWASFRVSWPWAPPARPCLHRSRLTLMIYYNTAGRPPKTHLELVEAVGELGAAVEVGAKAGARGEEGGAGVELGLHEPPQLLLSCLLAEAPLGHLGLVAPAALRQLADVLLSGGGGAGGGNTQHEISPME
jgi:hypothetical protein